ncbi:uncharacterized protein Tco025E_08596 [Trypanosoma conorhini]|uniref:Uncharacterized protein n=1 Tax=Trypanosoma conorhini TaxID=83891 RepID=A0A3R7KU32_9TRYP|nr:uncharacterized protein Tco025E_08596 [Trypanosoma conorhini]RNF01384.1 hypothetical protein Tco025E_08596 [Trypanosoma conorhini]
MGARRKHAHLRLTEEMFWRLPSLFPGISYFILFFLPGQEFFLVEVLDEAGCHRRFLCLRRRCYAGGSEGREQGHRDENFHRYNFGRACSRLHDQLHHPHRMFFEEIYWPEGGRMHWKTP